MVEVDAALSGEPCPGPGDVRLVVECLFFFKRCVCNVYLWGPQQCRMEIFLLRMESSLGRYSRLSMSLTPLNGYQRAFDAGKIKEEWNSSQWGRNRQMSHHDRGSGRGGRGNVGITGRRKWKRPRRSKEEVGSCWELGEAERRGEDPRATAPSPLLHATSS
jgi:hypothetical protein